MPPLIGETWHKVKGFLPGLLGGSGTDDSTTNSHAEAQTHAGQSEGMGMDGAAERPSAGTSGKRVRDSSSELRSLNNKKQRTYNQDEGRLTGRYNEPVPKDRVEIVVPTNNAMRPKPGASHQHKTQNNIHAPQPGRAGRSFPSFKSTAKPPAVVSSTRRAVRGKALDDGVGDGFGNQSKRRMTNGAPSASRTQNHVDLISDEEEDFGTVQAVNGIGVRSDGNSAPIDVDSQSQSATATDYFQAREQRNVNQFINGGQPSKKRRRKSSGQNTPSVSSFLPNDHHAPVRPVSGSRDQPMGIEDLAESVLASMPNATGVKKTRTRQIPPINLGVGVDDFDPESMQRRKDAHQLDKMNGNLRLLSKQPGKPAPLKGERSVNGAAEQQISHRLPPSSDHEQSPLRKLFIRDSDTTPQQQQQQQQPHRESVMKGMQVTSNNGKANAVEESPDQLQGGNTDFSRGQLKQRSHQTVAKSPTRQYSPSDLPPSPYRKSAQNPARTMQPARPSKRLAVRDDVARIPVEQIFSRGCVLDTMAKGNETMCVDLVWQTEHAHFAVEQNGNPFRILGTKEYMAIGKNEATTWHEGKDSTLVVLKGPKGENRSNGTILLSFIDQSGLRECHSWMFVATADTLKTKCEDNERIEKMFHNLATDVKVDTQRHAQQGKTKSAVNVVQAQQKSALRTRQQPVTSDNIVYEQPDEGAKQQVSARSRMKGDIEQTKSEQDTSPYFTGVDNPTTRKSTRQSKPVKERTPTPPPAPPRWTQTHELEEWHQSVMYPPIGARRVTVDFQDIERLDEGEFLNDNIVGYALRRIEQDIAPEHKSKVHFFNSYFFTSLTTKNGKKAFNYDSVKKWTKQNDLMNTPYIVVPMNENLHWFVAIICNLPSLQRKPALLGDEAADSAETPPISQTASAQLSPIRYPDEIPDSQEPDNVDKSDRPDDRAMGKLSLIDKDKESAAGSDTFEFDDNGQIASSALEAAREEEVAHTNGKSKGKKSKKRAAPSLKKYPTDKPTIITLDSFAVGHPGQVSTLKKYIEAEAMDKRGMEVSAADIQGMTAAGLPVQSNYCDCGLYLVGYVAEFARDPEGFVNKVLTRQLDQDSDFASFDPSAKRAEIRDDLLKLHDEQDQARVALKKAKKEEKEKKVAVTAVTTAVNVNAQTSGTPAASARPSPAPRPQPSAKQSVQAPSPMEKAVSPIASRGASEGPGPDPTADARESSTNDASSDEELEEQPPKPLLTAEPRRSKTKAAITAPDQGNRSAESSAEVEDGDQGEMLDEPGDLHEYSQRLTGHKVTSPELDSLSKILDNGPLPVSVSRSQDSSKSPPSVNNDVP